MDSRIHKWILFVFLFRGITGTASLQGQRTGSLTGNVSHFSVMFDASESGQWFGMPGRRLGLSSTRWRNAVRWAPARFVQIQMSYDAVFRIQDPVLFTSTQNPGFQTTGDYRLTDFPDAGLTPEPGGSFGLLQNLDRLFLSIRAGGVDIYLGRQAIAWGSARTVNPTDVIAPFSFESLDTEYRRGVDALRVRIPVGWMGEIDTGFLFGDADEAWAHAAYLRGKAYVRQTDLSLIAMQFQGHGLLGWDAARAVGGAGTWLEAAVVFPDLFRGKTSQSSDPYWRVTLGADYSFSGGWYGFAEYHFNGAGAADPRAYLNRIGHPAYEAGKVYLLGKHYGILGGHYQATPLWTIQSEIILNLGDGSLMLGPGMRYNLARNVDLSLGGFWSVGEARRSGLVMSVPESEFGMYPDFVSFSFQVYY